MKLAYLVIAHNNVKHLERLIDELNDGENFVFVHFDKRYNKLIKGFDFANKHNFRIFSSHKVYWGGFSIINVTIDLLKMAFTSGYIFDYYILLSGNEYPIRSQLVIKNYLQANYGYNFINQVKLPNANKSLNRIYNYYIEGGYRTKSTKAFFIRILNKFFKKLKIKRKFPYKGYTFYGGSQWWLLTNDTVKYVLEYIEKNKVFVKFFKHTFVPDEMFFQTIIMNSPMKDFIKPALFYADWSLGKGPYPSLIDEIHLSIIDSGKTVSNFYGKRDIFFARKFNDNSLEIIERIRNLNSFHT